MCLCDRQPVCAPSTLLAPVIPRLLHDDAVTFESCLEVTHDRGGTPPWVDGASDDGARTQSEGRPFPSRPCQMFFVSSHTFEERFYYKGGVDDRNDNADIALSDYDIHEPVGYYNYFDDLLAFKKRFNFFVGWREPLELFFTGP
jgi:hypothetical protein